MCITLMLLDPYVAPDRIELSYPSSKPGALAVVLRGNVEGAGFEPATP